MCLAITSVKFFGKTSTELGGILRIFPVEAVTRALFFPFVDLSYNIALCYYSMKQYAPALKHIADIIEKGIREHPGSISFNPLTTD